MLRCCSHFAGDGRWVMPLLRNRRQLLLLAAAAIAITFNWGTYIYGVNSDQVVETSLGYFINPLVSIMFGVVLLHERLRRLQWFAVAIAAVAVLVLAIDYGRLPWIALILAFSFGTYGLLKKTIDMGALESLSVETTLLFLPAMGFLVYLNIDGTSTLQEEGMGQAALLATTGLVTAIPLLFFGAAATRIPAELDRVAPVLGPSHSVSDRRGCLQRVHAGVSVDRVLIGVGRAGGPCHRRGRGSPAREVDQPCRERCCSSRSPLALAVPRDHEVAQAFQRQLGRSQRKWHQDAPGLVGMTSEVGVSPLHGLACPK